MVKAVIARDPSANMTLRSLASAAGCSPFHLCRVFQRATGSTITSYRHALRLRLSLDRLQDRRADLTGLALDLGYSSHSHFTMLFRRHFGVTPSEYRSERAARVVAATAAPSARLAAAELQRRA
jgi:AraC-like DNA-binding protein